MSTDSDINTEFQNNSPQFSQLSRWILITTDSGNPIFTTFTHIDPHFISLPLSTSQDVIFNSFSQGITSIKTENLPPLVVEQFDTLTFATCSNPNVDCILNSKEFLRYYLHILYHLIEFRFGPSFFSILKIKKRFRTKSYLPILTRLNRTLNMLLDTHPPTLIGSLQRVELKPHLLSQCRNEILKSIIIANSKSIDPGPFPFYHDFEPVSKGSDLPGFLSHGLLFIRNALVAVVGTFEHSSTSPSSLSENNTPLPKSKLLKKSTTLKTTPNNNISLNSQSSHGSVSNTPQNDNTSSQIPHNNKITMQLPVLLDGNQVLNLLIVLNSLFDEQIGHDIAVQDPATSTSSPDTLHNTTTPQEASPFFLEPLFLSCIDGEQRHTYCYFRSLGPETRLILVARPLQPTPKPNKKTPKPTKQFKSISVQNPPTKRLSQTDTQNLISLIKARCHRTASLVELRLQPFIEFVTLTATQQLDFIYNHYISAQPIPGLLYFCFAERSRYHTTCPAVSAFESLSTSLSKEELLSHVWRLFSFSFKAAAIGQTTFLFRRKDVIYSYSLWVESPPHPEHRAGSPRTLPRTPGVLSPWTVQSKYLSRPQTWHSTVLSSNDKSNSPYNAFSANKIQKKKTTTDPSTDSLFAEYDPSLPDLDPDYPLHPLEYDFNSPAENPRTLAPINVDWALPFWFPANNQSNHGKGNRIFQLFTLYKAPKNIDFTSIITLDQLLLEILRGPFSTK